MDVQGIVPPYLQAHLSDSLDKGLALDITDGAADLGDDHIRTCPLSNPINEAFDLIGDMGNGLHGAAQVLSSPLLGDDIGVDLAGGQVGEFVQILINEPLIMSQIQIRLRTVLCDIDLAVLIGAHGPGIHIDIGIQLLRRHLQAPRLQQPTQGSCRDPLAQTGHHAAGHKNELCHMPSSRKIKRDARQGAETPWRTPLFNSGYYTARTMPCQFQKRIFSDSALPGYL